MCFFSHTMYNVDYFSTYFFPVQHLTDRVSGYVHAHTLYSYARPFGVCMIMGSMEQDGPQMYLVEPSGVSWVGTCIDLRTPRRKGALP